MGINKCSCNGANPTCFKCDGWGYLEPGVRETPQQVAVLPNPKVENGKLKKKTNKSSAALLFSQRGNWAGAVGMRYRIMPDGRIECPICSVPVLEKNIEKHLRKVHSR